MLTTHSQYFNVSEPKTRPANRLIARVDSNLGRGIEINGDLMWLFVGGLRLPSEIRRRPRKNVEIVRKRGCQESKRKPQARAAEFVDGMRRKHFQTRLRKCRNRTRLRTHHAVADPINPHQTQKRMNRAGPMLRR